MKIGGFVKQSLIDYPGKIAAVVFTSGCNFRCGYCHNPQLVLPEMISKSTFIKEKEVFDFIEKRLGWLDGIVVTGGEPTIHADLPEFLQKIKQRGLLVKLDTNGSNPEMIRLLLHENLIDYIAMDIKTLLKEESYSEIIGIKSSLVFDKIIESVALLKESKVEVEFRTTLIPDIQSLEDIDSIKCAVGTMRYNVNSFRNGILVSNYL
jgi:pyruvate formate lyase activating enzyme